MPEIYQITDEKKQKRFMIALLLTNIIAMLNTTTVTLSLPTYMEVFGVNISTVQWVSVGYMLPLGMVMPLSGYLGERYGYRKVFLTGLSVIGISSVACACSISFHMLVFFRFLKGVAAGLVIPSTMAMLYRYIPKRYQPGYMGQLVLFQSVGVAIGPSLAGFILQFFSWHILFLFNVPIILLAIFMGRKYMLDEPGHPTGSIDFLGILQVSFGTGLVMIAFTEGEVWGWKSALFLACLAVGLALILIFVIRQFRTKTPLLNFKVLKYRPFTIALLIQCTLAMTLGITAILLQLYLQSVRGYPPAATGLMVLIPSLIMLVGNEFANKMHAKSSVRTMIAGGMLITVIGNLAWCNVKVDTSVLLLIVFFSIRYFGMGVLQMPLTDYGLGSVPVELAGHASSMYNWGKQFVQVVSMNILTVVMSVNLTRYYLEAGNTGVPVQGTEAYNLAASQAVSTDFIYMTIALCLSLITALFIKKEKHNG